MENDALEKIVFFDLETAGGDITQPITQIAAIAVDSSLCELESYEVKILFNEDDADPAALHRNHYDPDVWTGEAVDKKTAAYGFKKFLQRHATYDMVSREGNPYQIAQLVAHNGELFDGPFIHEWYRQLGFRCPARYLVLCTKQRAMWMFQEDRALTPPADYKLGTLCEYFGIQLRPEEAHDALADVRATLNLYRAMTEHQRASSVYQANGHLTWVRAN